MKSNVLLEYTDI